MCDEKEPSWKKRNFFSLKVKEKGNYVQKAAESKQQRAHRLIRGMAGYYMAKNWKDFFCFEYASY